MAGDDIPPGAFSAGSRQQIKQKPGKAGNGAKSTLFRHGIRGDPDKRRQIAQRADPEPGKMGVKSAYNIYYVYYYKNSLTH